MIRIFGYIKSEQFSSIQKLFGVKDEKITCEESESKWIITKYGLVAFEGHPGHVLEGEEIQINFPNGFLPNNDVYESKEAVMFVKGNYFPITNVMIYS